MKKNSRRARKCLYATSILVVACLTLALILTNEKLYENRTSPVYNISTLVLYFITGFFSIYMLLMLIYIIQSNFKDKLGKERRQLLVC